MTEEIELREGRASFEHRRWGDAFARLSAADAHAPLAPEDLDLLAASAFLLGRDAESEDARVRAYNAHLSHDDPVSASRSAFWLGFALLNKGDMARGSGWLARSQRLIDEAQVDCAERGYLLMPAGIQSVESGDAATGLAHFTEALEVGRRFRDPDLIALALHGKGRTLIRLGSTAEGIALLDEAMVAITAGEVSAIVAGDVYCGVIEACGEIFDVRRAHEWTHALDSWCSSQPDLVPYRGQCLVHRSELMQLRGAWAEAAEEANRACEQLAGHPAAGDAFYQCGEVHRLSGRFVDAEEAYRQAGLFGRSPEPGLALLRLAQGKIDAAVAGIGLAVEEAEDDVVRARLLPAHVEIMLVAGDLDAARRSTERLAEVARSLDAPLLHAIAEYARGALLAGEGGARRSLGPLRRSLKGWHRLEAPYEAARVRVLIGLACRALGDLDSAEIEIDAARQAFERLGAASDLARLAELTGATRDAGGGLTGRELEVLRLVASGKTNRGIAEGLVISEKTVARHISNIFTKLGLSSRAAATAYAYEHDLV
jgi:DNA-binding CsgD family transcriptional regulator